MAEVICSYPPKITHLVVQCLKVLAFINFLCLLKNHNTLNLMVFFIFFSTTFPKYQGIWINKNILLTTEEPMQFSYLLLQKDIFLVYSFP